MHCERCDKNITSHHKCSGCEKWVGRCCLIKTDPNVCYLCTA